jgi:hypothetical protein
LQEEKFGSSIGTGILHKNDQNAALKRRQFFCRRVIEIAPK